MDKIKQHKKLKIGAINAIRVIMNPLNWYKLSDGNYSYEVLNVLNKYKYIHVFFYEKRDHWFYDIKFKKSLIDSIKNWLKKREELLRDDAAAAE